jgi:hypothetical protein
MNSVSTTNISDDDFDRPSGTGPLYIATQALPCLATIGLSLRISSPFRAKRLFWLTQGKPWAKLSCPFGAELSGRITGPKHIL